MNTTSLMRRGMIAAAALALGACNMDVINPGVIDAAHFDPSSDAATISLSAQSNFYKAYTGSVYWSAFFSGEAIVGAVRQETNDVGRRVATSSTSDVGSAWGILQRSLATNELAIQTLVKGANAASDINLARVYMNSGFSLILLAETYCQETNCVGPPLTPARTPYVPCAYAGLLIIAITAISPSAHQNRRVMLLSPPRKMPVTRAPDTPEL